MSTHSGPGEGWRAGWFGLRSRPYLLLTLTTLFWSGNWIVGRAARTEIAAIPLAYWRWVTALAIFLPFALPAMWAQRGLILREWKIMLVFSALGVPLFHGLILTALSTTTAINAALVNSAMPVVIVALSWGIDRETISRRQALGIAISLAGVVVILSRADPAVVRGLRFVPGDLWALASVPVWGLYSVLLRRRPAALLPSAFLGTIMLVGVLLMTPAYFWVAGFRPSAPSPGLLAAVAYMALFPAVLAYNFWNRAVELVGANKAGQFAHLIPVFTTGLAIVLLGESLHLFHLAGIALIAAGIYLTTQAKTPAL